MGSLQRPPYDELRERDLREREMRDREREGGPGGGRPRGPLTGALGPGMGPGSALATSHPPTPIGGRPPDPMTHGLPGPGLHPSALGEKRERDRERHYIAILLISQPFHR